MNFLLDVNNIDLTKPIGSLSDKLIYGGRMLLIGICTVFSVLIVLMLTLVAFKFFFHDLARGKKHTKAIKNEQTAPVKEVTAVSDDEEIIAVIAAAIAMAENDCGGNKNFRVVSFKRK